MQAVSEPGATAADDAAPGPDPAGEEVLEQAGVMACGRQAGPSDSDERLYLQPSPPPDGSRARPHAPHAQKKGKKGTSAASSTAC